MGAADKKTISSPASRARRGIRAEKDLARHLRA